MSGLFRGPAGPFPGRVWLAPLTFGGNLPFRRLCVEMGAPVTVGEMAVVRNLLRNEAREFALLRSHASEPFFGVQLADRRAETLAEGARIAVERGARFVDLNCGCPIEDMTRRGIGAALLRQPSRVARLAEAMVRAVPVPVTVKVRAGWKAGEVNALEVARLCEEAGAAAVVLHGRTREQRYTKAADWDLVGGMAAERRIPVVGNGDILTHYEARARMRQAGCAAVMVARGALIKPWIFREILEDRGWLPTAEERLGVVWRFVELLREHFRDDEKGRRRILRFLPWHLGFFCRYRPLPEEEYGEAAARHPLLQTRFGDEEGLAPLERLLRDPRPDVHARFAEVLVGCASFREALERCTETAAALPERREGEEEAEVSAAQVTG